MKNFDATFAAEIKKNVVSMFYLLELDLTPTGTATSFVGTGNNDMTVPGIDTKGMAVGYLGTYTDNFKVLIDGVGSPNTFKWSTDGGTTWIATGVDITAGLQTLADGMQIQFGATTGHGNGDYWTFTCQPGTLKYTDADTPIYYNGLRYTPIRFSFPELTVDATMAVDQVNLDIDNADREISAVVLGQDVRNKIAILYFGVRYLGTGLAASQWDSADQWEAGSVDSWDTAPMQFYSYAVQEYFRGVISGWEIDGDTKVSMTISNEFILWNKKSLREHPSTCPWPFKGVECAYVGAGLTCDQSYERCQTYNNTVNFGGFRFLPSLVNKQIWWGKIPT